MTVQEAHMVHLVGPFRPFVRQIAFALGVGLLFVPFGRVAAAELEIGASVGVIRSTIAGSVPAGSSFESLGTGSAAIAIAYRLARDVSLLLEPGYAAAGAQVAVEALDTPEKKGVLDVRIPYYSLPVGVRIASSGGRGFVVGGFEARWIQDVEAELLVAPGGTTDITDRISPFDLAMNMGAGYCFPWDRVRVQLEARYSQGLLNLDDGVSEQVEAPFPLRFRANGLGLVLRLMIPVHLGGGSDAS
jgi:hypothetical protein